MTGMRWERVIWQNQKPKHHTGKKTNVVFLTWYRNVEKLVDETGFVAS